MAHLSNVWMIYLLAMVFFNNYPEEPVSQPSQLQPALLARPVSSWLSPPSARQSAGERKAVRGAVFFCSQEAAKIMIFIRFKGSSGI